jgi:hypothetical protein
LIGVSWSKDLGVPVDHLVDGRLARVKRGYRTFSFKILTAFHGQGLFHAQQAYVELDHDVDGSGHAGLGELIWTLAWTDLGRETGCAKYCHWTSWICTNGSASIFCAPRRQAFSAYEPWSSCLLKFGIDHGTSTAQV